MSDKNVESDKESLETVFVIDFEQVEQISRVFFGESKEILSELDSLILRLEQNPSDQESLNILFRKVHTIKGSVGAVPGGQLMGSVAHEFEALLLVIKRVLPPGPKLEGFESDCCGGKFRRRRDLRNNYQRSRSRYATSGSIQRHNC